MADWNKIFQDEYNFSQNGVSPDSAKYEQLLQQELAQMLKEQQSYEEDLKVKRDERLRQAYVTKRKAERDTPAMLAEAGISGGVTETALMDILREYFNSRNTAQSDYLSELNDKTNEYAKNKNDLTLKYRNLIDEANEKARSEALKRANIAKQMAAEQEKANASSSGGSGRKSSKSSKKSSVADTTLKLRKAARTFMRADASKNALNPYIKGTGRMK